MKILKTLQVNSPKRFFSSAFVNKVGIPTPSLFCKEDEFIKNREKKERNHILQ